MKSKEKKKKSLLRRIIKWTSISLLTLIVILITIPFIFKDEIKEMVIDEVNTSLNAKLSMGDFDLTFLSTFPNMTIQLNDTRLEGIGKFKGVELANIKQLTAHVGLWSVISGDQVEIDEIHMEEPRFDVRILSDGTANYDIVKPDSVKSPQQKKEPSNFKLSLNEYTITKAKIKYDDQSSDMFIEINNLNHTGTGDLTADVIDFATTTTMDQMTFDMDGVSYLTEVNTNIIANILMEFTDKSSKFTLKENEFKLNALTFKVDGFYEMLEGYDNIDLKLNASKATFKDFLSLIPAFYQSGYEKMISKGNLEMGGEVKGRMDEKNIPGWDFNLNVDNASISYPDLPGKINNIILIAGSKFKGGSNTDLMTVDVEKFHADFAGNTIDANLKMRNPETDPLLISKIKANVNLATLKKVIPLAEGESYTGKLKADVDINGRMSALDRGDYEAFKASGIIEIKDMMYATKELNDQVAIAKLILRFSPKNLLLENLEATTGKSDFEMNGSIDNYMGYLFREELLKGNFNFISRNLDLDQLMNLVPSSETVAVVNTEPTPTSAEPTLIPDNIDFMLNTDITNLHYNGMNIKNVKGAVKMKDEIASIENLTMNTMGGTVGLKGSYDTKDHTKPKINFAYDLKGIDIHELATNFVTVAKLAPIANYAKGKISSNLEMKSFLTANLEPIYSSLTGLGDFTTNSLSISGFKPMEKMADELNIKKLSNQTVKDVNAKFSFADGKVTVRPFDVSMGKIKTTISGTTSFEQAIDYDIKMLIPKEEIPTAMIKTVEQAISKINSLSPKLDLKAIPDVIPVKVGMGGTVMNPKITNNFKEALLAATGNLKDNMINNVKEAVKDTVKAVIDQKVNEVKEDLNAKKQAILADAQKQADKVKADAKKAADTIRAQADKEAAELMKQAGSNPLKQKGAEVAGKKLKKEAEEKAQKLESEAVKKADQLMATARQKADQVK